MQTFLPLPSFHASASVLDDKRLGKQRVEAFQILKTLTTGRKAWSNHPAVRMWRGYEDALTCYMNVMIGEWVRRGFRNTMKPETVATPAPLPPWFGRPAFHAAHRAALLAKDPVHYGRFGWTERLEIAYVWPV